MAAPVLRPMLAGFQATASPFFAPAPIQNKILRLSSEHLFRKSHSISTHITIC